jgi:pimeloyl-ACP methyl ester carboxylesterase
MKQIIKYGYAKTLSYADYGDRKGIPILVQHGLIASIHDYYLFDRLIAAGRRVISIARPGYGESSPDCMNNISEWGSIISVLVDQLQLSHFDVLGLSSGAPYSYAIGYKLPEKTRYIYIFSGIPALYDDKVVEFWPYPVNRYASIAELVKVAKEIFFSNLTEESLLRNDIRDSMMNNCFGVAQDLHLRSVDWGFKLAEVKQTVYMEHCKLDTAVPLITAEMTAKMLPNCWIEIRETGEHFSEEVLDDFIRKVILRYL